MEGTINYTRKGGVTEEIFQKETSVTTESFSSGYSRAVIFQINIIAVSAETPMIFCLNSF